MKKLLLALGTITAVAAPVAAVVACGSKEEHTGYGVLHDMNFDSKTHDKISADTLLSALVDLSDIALADIDKQTYKEEIDVLTKVTIKTDAHFIIKWQDASKAIQTYEADTVADAKTKLDAIGAKKLAAAFTNTNGTFNPVTKPSP